MRWGRAVITAVALTVASPVVAGPVAATTTTVDPDARRDSLDAEAADADRTVRLAVGGLLVAAVASGVLTWRYVVYTDPAKGYVRSRVRRPVKHPDPR